ncbi:MAG: HTH-type transcriptional regulator GbpR [Steroidobacteraceae bacterium]|nr:HTH-type transcriptional regulator GbpR [Steroidobacteraceae bacterium]
MDLRQLRYFLAVAELGSFTRAAAVTGRTQQALSKGIHALEHQLGARLFERGAREARLTQIGRLLVEHARTADDALRSFEARLVELQTGDEGEVRIGTGPTTAGSLVAPAVLTLRRFWPKIRVKVTTGILPELMPALLTRELDVVVTLNTMTDAESESDARFHAETLMHDEYRIVASVRHPLADQRNITPQQLLQASWIFGRRLGPVQDAFRARFLEAGLEPPQQQIETTSLEFLRALVHDGGYLCLLPLRLAQADLAAGKWITLDAPGFSWERPVVAYSRAGEPHAVPVHRLLQALRNSVAQAEEAG